VLHARADVPCDAGDEDDGAGGCFLAWVVVLALRYVGVFGPLRWRRLGLQGRSL